MFEHVQSVIGPYVSGPVICRDHDPRAAGVAAQLAAVIAAHLPRLRVEHIGSTAVPGCAGWGIIDLLVPVAEDDLREADELFGRLGFSHPAEANPFFAGRSAYTGSWPHEGETFLLHVYAIPPGAPEVDAMRFFRTCLQVDAELVAAYVARKRAILAGGATESAAYCRGKAEFLNAVLG